MRWAPARRLVAQSEGDGMAGDVAATRSKVQQYLTHNFNNVNIDENSDFSLRHGSARVFVRTRSAEKADFTWISLDIPVLREVKETPQVLEYVALHADQYVFGHLSAARTNDGLIIWLSHALLGDYLDEQELLRAVGAMLSTAEQIDDELQAQFGGKRFHED
jgi:Putative bacterial sensory transduction regulator